MPDQPGPTCADAMTLEDAVAAGPTEGAHASNRTLGMVAVLVAIVCFSSTSTLVRSADASGVTVAAWRMLLASVVWYLVLLVRRRPLGIVRMRRTVVPGIFFGANLAIFFTALAHTSVAHVEVIANMSPIILVPIGGLLFHEHLRTTALAWAAVAIAGMVVVLLAGSGSGTAGVRGDLLACCGVLMWTGYLVTTKKVRGDMDVAQYMAGVTTFAAILLFAVASASGVALDVPVRDWGVILALTLVTGIAAHGLIVFAQHHLPVISIATMQVAQPVLGVTWAYLVLGEAVAPAQVLGGALVVAGLAAFTLTSRPRAGSPAAGDDVVANWSPE